MLKRLTLMSVISILTSCSETPTATPQAIPEERFDTEHEALFQQEAALRHTLEELQTLEKEEKAYQAVAPVE